MGLQEVWGPLLAWDLFLGGAGAGAYLVAVIALAAGGRYLALSRPGIYVGPPLVALGALLLLAELGQPLRFLRGFARPGDSMMSVGMILISVFLVLGVLHIVAPRLGLTERAQRWLGLVNALFALGVMTYTGMLLGLVKAVPFWNTPLLPVLFVVSALVTGLSAVMLALALQRWVRPAGGPEAGESVVALGPAVAFLVVLELLALFSLVFLMGNARTTAVESAQYLLAGGYAATFWLGVVLIGLLVPLGLVAWVTAQKGKLALGRAVNVTALAALCLLVGGLLLRYAVLAAGAKMPLV